MAIPNEVRQSVCNLMWDQADDLNWTHLNIFHKAQQYKIWAQDERIGQVLSRYMPLERVHPYIKDSLMKPYAKSKKPGKLDIFRVLSFNSEATISNEYIKPHGVRLDDGRIISWGRAVDWKIVLLATFERSKENIANVPYAAVLSESSARFSSDSFRNIIQEAASLLKIQRLIFKD